MVKHSMIVALGALSFGMLSSFAKIAYSQGYNAAEITFAQAALGAVILWGVVLFNKIRNRQYKTQLSWKLLAVGSCMGISVYTYYLALTYIPASLAIVLLMQMTWISMLAEAVLYKKIPSRIEVITAVFILLGTIFAANLLNVKELKFSLVGIILALISALLYSLFVLLTSKLDKDIPSYEKGAMVTTGSAIIIAIINFKSLTSGSHINSGLFQWGSFLAIFGTVIPPICFNKGMPKIGPSLSSILLTLELPAAIFCAHMILSEEVSLSQITGVVIILFSIAYLNIQKARKESLPVMSID